MDKLGIDDGSAGNEELKMALEKDKRKRRDKNDERRAKRYEEKCKRRDERAAAKKEKEVKKGSKKGECYQSCRVLQFRVRSKINNFIR